MIDVLVFNAENTRPYAAANDGPIIALFVRYRQCMNRSMITGFTLYDLRLSSPDAK